MTDSMSRVANSSWVREWFPPVLRRFANRILGSHIVYLGPFKDFVTAQQLTAGYSDAGILEQARWATEQVLAGRARYQQDGKPFLSEPPADLALSGLLLGAARSGGRLSVLDFGGSLGSHFQRWQPLLDRVPELTWCVVEQAHFVAAGRALFASDPRIRFEETIEAAAALTPNVIFASSVLQYLAEPEHKLGELAALGADILVVDRLPVARAGGRRIMTQHLPARTGRASYPLHVFDGEWLQSHLGDRYLTLGQFAARDEPIHAGAFHADYVGSIWLRRP